MRVIFDYDDGQAIADSDVAFREGDVVLLDGRRFMVATCWFEAVEVDSHPGVPLSVRARVTLH